MTVSMDKIKQLRQETGAGISTCKQALLAVPDHDIEAAREWLYRKGMSSGLKKADRAAGEGGIFVLVNEDKDGAIGRILEINSETDFVAKSQDMQNFVRTISPIVLQTSSLEGLKNFVYEGNSVLDRTLALAGKVGENIVLRRMEALDVHSGVVVSYAHMPFFDGFGQIGVLVGLVSSGPKEELKALGKDLAMHIAASSPRYVTKAQIPAERIAQEREIIQEQIQADPAYQSKTPEIITKMVEGRLSKVLEAEVLEEQSFVKDPQKKVKDIVQETGRRIGHPIQISNFILHRLGQEG